MQTLSEDRPETLSEEFTQRVGLMYLAEMHENHRFISHLWRPLHQLIEVDVTTGSRDLDPLLLSDESALEDQDLSIERFRRGA